MRSYNETVRPHMGTTADFNHKLKPFTCEWLARPFAATVDANLDKLTDLAALAEETNLLQSAGKKMKKVAKDILFRFVFFDCLLFFYRLFLFAACSSITRSGKSISKQDVCDLQREVLFEHDSSYAIVLNEVYVVGASIAIMVLQLKVANFALQDLGRLAGLCTTTKSAKDFRSNPKAKTFPGLLVHT